MSTTPTELLETTAATLETLASDVILDPTAATEAGLDFRSIKEAMDAFDPASLLPELSEIFGTLPQVCRIAVMIGPIVLLALGLAYLFLSPKEANHYFGYRCYFGMGSVNAWHFTQRLAGAVLGSLGLILTVVMYAITGKFDAMDVTEMVWKALDCLIWQAILAFLANLAINVAAAIRFDRKGEYRKNKRKKQA